MTCDTVRLGTLGYQRCVLDPHDRETSHRSQDGLRYESDSPDAWRDETWGQDDRPTTDDLEALPVLCEGQADDLHYEDGPLRFWLSRTERADGEPYDNTVTIELRDDEGRWAPFVQYDGDDPDGTDLFPEED